jgi:hypothetical protein
LGLEVWYDDDDLRKGEQIREGLDNGLKKSEFGVIVLSKNYFIKGWTRLELNALLDLSVYTKKIIIPIWYGVNKRDVVAFSLMISTINAFQSTDGIDKISSGIYDIIKSTDKDQPIEIRYENSDPEVRKIQNKRFRFLLRLYELRDREFLRDREAIGTELGFDISTLNEISQYCFEKDYIEYTATGCVEITVWGMDYVEELMADSIDVQTVQSNRDMVLRKLYDGRAQAQRFDMWILGSELAFPNQKVTYDVMYYLRIKNLIEWHFTLVWITTEGIDYVENNLF